MKFYFTFLLLFLITVTVVSQGDAESLLDDLISNEPEIVEATFKASRVVNGHSVAQPDVGEMEFRISHRFGKLNGGGYELFGLDQTTIHFSLEYSPFERFTVGIGRSNYLKTYDGYLKYAIIRQQKGAKNIPLSLSYVASSEYYTQRVETENFENKHRFSHVHQLLIASKINKRISLQISPTSVHRNLVDNSEIKNTNLAAGIGGRFKVTNRLSINGEFFWVDDLSAADDIKLYYPISVGIDLETGGHVFQIMVTNSLSMRETGFLTNTTETWTDGGLHFGFNISRMFHLHK